MRIKPDTLKTCLEIGTKLAILGGFAIFTLHCIYIQRLPDADLPTLLVLFGTSCCLFVVLVFGTSVWVFFPPFFIRNLLQLRCESTQDLNKPAYPGAALPGVWLSFSGWLVLVGLRLKHPLWMTLTSVALIWGVLPAFLAAFTKRYWVRVHGQRSSIIESEMRGPSGWFPVFGAFVIWTLCSTVFVVILSEITISEPSEWVLALVIGLLVLLANSVIVPRW